LKVDVLFVGMRVRDFAVANEWYRRFFARPADIVAHDEEVMWQLIGEGWLYIVREDDPGGGLAALAVADLDATVAELAGRGIVAGPIEPQGDAGRKAIVADPDGNKLALIGVGGRLEVGSSGRNRPSPREV
jgi:predicted enzyme related to lactoylglutathione lyase